MWIASTLGFYSIVQKGKGYHVRARDAADLMRLLARVPSVKEEIQLDAGTDYAARVVVNGNGLMHIMGALGSTIDYPNFKGAIKESQTQHPKLEAYSRLWWELQRVNPVINPSAAELVERHANRRTKPEEGTSKALTAEVKAMTITVLAAKVGSKCHTFEMRPYDGKMVGVCLLDGKRMRTAEARAILEAKYIALKGGK